MPKSAKTPLPPLDIKQRYTVDEALRYLRTSRAQLYKLIAKGSLHTLKEGARRYIPGSEIARRSVMTA